MDEQAKDESSLGGNIAVAYCIIRIMVAYTEIISFKSKVQLWCFYDEHAKVM